MFDLDALTDEILARCDALALCSEEPHELTRTFLRPCVHDAHKLLRDWMTEAGLAVRCDAVGNLIGRRAGRCDDVFAVGSHIDTVPNAGKYDGVLGVLLGIAAAQALGEQSMKCSLDVLAFSEEEGVRFRTPYLGSRAVCGCFDLSLLHLIDEHGISMSQAIRDFGLEPNAVAAAAYPSGQLVGYFEAHIEQGPVLESLDQSLGVVTAIAGQSRHRLHFAGLAGHVGTQPMELRRDALAAAAEFVGVVETTAKNTPGLRATVGSLTVSPGAVNVVPGNVELSVDVRHGDDALRESAVEQLLVAAQSIGQRRGIGVDGNCLLSTTAVPCDQRLTQALRDRGPIAHELVSGAGHDAVIMATRCPVAMLFLRSPGGISHHPAESVRPEDVRAALATMIRFLEHELNRE